MYLGARQARKLKLTTGRKPVTVAKDDASFRATGIGHVVLEFTKKARKRLKQARAVRLALKATISANNQSRTRTYKLRLAVKH